MTSCEETKEAIPLTREQDCAQVAQERLSSALDAVRETARLMPSREASLAVTNLEQSQMWLDRSLLPVLKDVPE